MVPTLRSHSIDLPVESSEFLEEQRIGIEDISLAGIYERISHRGEFTVLGPAEADIDILPGFVEQFPFDASRYVLTGEDGVRAIFVRDGDAILRNILKYTLVIVLGTE